MIDWVLDLRERLGIPHTLAELGIGTEQAEKVGRMAVADPSSGTNPSASRRSSIATSSLLRSKAVSSGSAPSGRQREEGQCA